MTGDPIAHTHASAKSPEHSIRCRQTNIWETVSTSRYPESLSWRILCASKLDRRVHDETNAPKIDVGDCCGRFRRLHNYGAKLTFGLSGFCPSKRIRVGRDASRIRRPFRSLGLSSITKIDLRSRSRERMSTGRENVPCSSADGVFRICSLYSRDNESGRDTRVGGAVVRGSRFECLVYARINGCTVDVFRWRRSQDFGLGACIASKNTRSYILYL